MSCNFGNIMTKYLFSFSRCIRATEIFFLHQIIIKNIVRNLKVIYGMVYGSVGELVPGE